MKILFICKHNRFRSKVAEAIFNSLNKNPAHKSDSAGLMLDDLRPYVEEKVLKIMKNKGYEIKNQTPKQATREFAKRFNLIIIAADDIEKDFFKGLGSKIEKWEIEDCGINDEEKIKTIVDVVERKITRLINNLKSYSI